MAQNQKTEALPLLNVDELPQITPPEHEFVRLLIHEGKTAAAAYRKAFPHEMEDLSETALWSRAARLRGDARIQGWESALLSWGMASGVLEHEQYVREMQALARRAEKAGNFGAAVNAMREAGQVAGLKEQKINVTHTMDVSNLMDDFRELLGHEGAKHAALELGLIEDVEYHEI